jgi:hypothetical protein
MTRAAFIPAGVWFGIVALLAVWPSPVAGRDKKGVDYGAGLVVSLASPASEVAPIVEEIAQNGIIHGSKEYNKDEYISGAVPVPYSKSFPAWTGGGKVFYKERKQALDPRNFKDSGDLGTLTVRYVVQPQGDHNTILHIDAVFVEDFRRTAHASNGSVESAECKDIQEHLSAVELIKKQTSESEKQRQQQLEKKNLAVPSQAVAASDSSSSSKNHPSSTEIIAQNAPSSAPGAARNITPNKTAEAQNFAADSTSDAISSSDSTAAHSAPVALSVGVIERAGDAPQSPASSESLEEHVKTLRRQLEWLVKSPGAPLKSSPFFSAHTLESLPAGAEVLILISTPYWYGVETHEGQHGWISRGDLEQRP